MNDKSREDLYNMLKRFIDSDLAEPGVMDEEVEVAEGGSAMLLRPGMASMHMRLHMQKLGSGGGGGGGRDKQISPATSSTHILNPRFLSRMASYDVTSDLCQAPHSSHIESSCFELHGI
jgi:hypothetical protein